MQLKSGATLRGKLALATCTLLSGAAHSATGQWQVDSSVLFYEEEERVRVIEPTVFATRHMADEESVTVRTVYDTLTGASPNGAITTTTPQTFSGASGAGAYTTPAGELPTRSFEDTRVAVGVDWDKRVAPLLRRALGINVSREEDYFSLGGSMSYAKDLNRKLTTLSLGGGFAFDSVQPHGGAPVGLQRLSMAASALEGRENEREDEDERDDHDDGEDDGERKFTADLMVGITQVLSRRSLVQINYTRSRLEGYLTDPYKVVSLVDPVSGATLDYLFEKRPKQRNADILYTKFVHHFERDVAHLSYRYFQDDWGIRSHTADLEYRYQAGPKVYVEPQFRYYTQAAADFFHYSLAVDGTADYVSADLRLAEMESTTAGVKVGIRLPSGELSVRAARMRQWGDSHPDNAIGVQKEVDLFPSLDATIINASYSVSW